MPNTHRRRRRDETVELRRVGGVNTPVGSRDPVYNFVCLQWRRNDVIVEKVIKIHEYYAADKNRPIFVGRPIFHCRPIISADFYRSSDIGFTLH